MDPRRSDTFPLNSEVILCVDGGINTAFFTVIVTISFTKTTDGNLSMPVFRNVYVSMIDPFNRQPNPIGSFVAKQVKFTVTGQ